mmetsp:Transcript_4553/g.10201  ORF Transcript_4553/g.10201 Transcript_4553/m.10201 type:complete len:337 (+) Transcript_4553:99-1109(+)
MSKEFAQSFFPSFTSFVSSPDLAPSFLVNSWDFIFPDDVVTLCSLPPKVAYIPRRPCLAIASLIGAYIGLNLKSGRRILPREDSIHAILVNSIHESWVKSRVAFGLMNVAALLHHCIIPPPISYQNMNSARKYVDNITWGADCIFTGLSSINLFIMAWLVYKSCAEKKSSKEVKSLTHSIGRLRLSVHVALFTIAVTLPMILDLVFRNGHIDFWSAASTTVEMVYLIPLGAAASLLFPLVVATAFKDFGVCKKGSVDGARVAIFGAILIMASLPLDASLCYFVSNHVPNIKTSPLLHDIYHLPTLLFVGCDVVFWGFHMWINDLINELLAKNIKDA